MACLLRNSGGGSITEPLHYALYFLIGWSGLIFVPDLFRNDFLLFLFILGGGILYTIGMIPFGLRRKGSHFIWHIFVLLGAAAQWFGIYLFVY